jgi:hypothetical protein
MFELKRISPDAIPAALSKIERYRLLNQSFAAESICRDILAIEPDNQAALVNFILCLTDEFTYEIATRRSEAEDAVTRLTSEYERMYYRGIICERSGTALYRRATPGIGPVVYDWLQKAMHWYEEAERLRPPHNDDAVLRWNTCARLIMQHADIQLGTVTIPPIELE